MDKYFKSPGDLDVENNESNTYFFVPGDLDSNDKEDVAINIDDFSVLEINNYLQSVVSGKEYDFECELGTLCSSGSCIVSFQELKEMVDAGSYNIISAICFNKEMIEIKYQEFDKELSFRMK